MATTSVKAAVLSLWGRAGDCIWEVGKRGGSFGEEEHRRRQKPAPSPPSLPIPDSRVNEYGVAQAPNAVSRG
jgi:hypothetical protein